MQPLEIKITRLETDTFIGDVLRVKSKNGLSTFKAPDIDYENIHNMARYFSIELDGTTPSEKFYETPPYFPDTIVKTDVGMIDIFEKPLRKYSQEELKTFRGEKNIKCFVELFLEIFPYCEIPSIEELIALKIATERGLFSRKKEEVYKEAFKDGLTSATPYANPHYRYVIRQEIRSIPAYVACEGFSVARSTIPIAH